MVQLITETLFDAVAERAASSPRRRMNHNFHSSPQENPHRFLNVLLKGTYIRPHRHVDPPKTETFVVLEGEAEVLVFDAGGQVTERYLLGRRTAAGKNWGIDLPPGIWHTILAVTDRVTCLEVKPGPWEPATDKDWAPWAPQESDPSAADYLKSLAAPR